MTATSPRTILAIANVVAGLIIAASISAASAGEDDFIYVDRMPDISGELERTIAVDDEEGGQRIVQDLYARDYDHAVIETYVLAVACAGGTARLALDTFIIAVKYPPKRPKTFTVATLHDIYKEVYARDGSGRIRLYEDVSGPSMLTLSERFKPACIPI